MYVWHSTTFALSHLALKRLIFIVSPAEAVRRREDVPGVDDGAAARGAVLGPQQHDPRPSLGLVPVHDASVVLAWGEKKIDGN